MKKVTFSFTFTRKHCTRYKAIKLCTKYIQYTNEGRFTSYLDDKIYIFLFFVRFFNIIKSDLYLVHLVKVYNSLCHKIFKDVNGSWIIHKCATCEKYRKSLWVKILFIIFLCIFKYQEIKSWTKPWGTPFDLAYIYD